MNDFVVSIKGSKIKVVLESPNSILINDKKYEYDFYPISVHTYVLKLGNKLYEISGEKITSENVSISIKGHYLEAVVRTALQEKASKLLEETANQSQTIKVRSPMPGLILKLQKRKGDQVSKGESVLILEAMKMENNIKAPISGKISLLSVKQDEAVEKNTILFIIDQS